MDEREINKEVRHEERLRTREEEARANRSFLGVKLFSVVLIFVFGIAVTFLFCVQRRAVDRWQRLRHWCWDATSLSTALRLQS